MSVYDHNKESPWAILDPSLKQQTFFWDPTSPSAKPTCLDLPIDFAKYQQGQYIQYQETFSSDADNQVEDEEIKINVQAYLKELEEMEAELSYYRNSIYSEKLKFLEDELLSIEKDTHKYILKQDKKLTKKRDTELKAKEVMYQYELEAIGKQVEHEKLKIFKDIEEKAGLARRVLTSAGSLYTGTTTTTNTKKRKEKSPSYSDLDDIFDDIEEPGFKRIHLKQKIRKLQAIADRQRAVKSKNNLDDALKTIDEHDLDNDMILIKKNIASGSED